jgi:hypothetical protein
MMNCELQGNSRVFQGGSRPNSTKKVSPNQFTFVDVNYTAVDKAKSDSPNLFQENINIFWNGGTIDVDGHFVGCAFAPMKTQNGIIGVHLYNTNRSSSKEFSTGDAYHWEIAPGTNAWTRYWSSEKICVAIVDNVAYATEEEVVAAIKNGSVVVLMRSGSPRGPRDKNRFPSYIARSTDNCRTWSKPEIFDEIGVLPQITRLGCGVTIATYGRPVIYLKATDDPSGREWEEHIPIELSPSDHDRSCCYTRILPIDDHSALLAYSDFNYPDPCGEPQKSILVRKITVIK